MTWGRSQRSRALLCIRHCHWKAGTYNSCSSGRRNKLRLKQQQQLSSQDWAMFGPFCVLHNVLALCVQHNYRGVLFLSNPLWSQWSCVMWVCVKLLMFNRRAPRPNSGCQPPDQGPSSTFSGSFRTSFEMKAIPQIPACRLPSVDPIFFLTRCTKATWPSDRAHRFQPQVVGTGILPLSLISYVGH